MTKSPQAISPPEPLHGLELIRICLETFEVHLKFEANNTLQLSCLFKVITPAGEELLIDPAKRIGVITELWKFVGARVVSMEWRDEIGIDFSNGYKLLVLAAAGTPRGALLGPHHLGEGYDVF